MQSLLFAAVFALFLVGAPSLGQTEEPSEESPPPEQLAREGVEKLMRALDALIEMIPQFEMPELNENGDIIIRRKRDDAPDKPPSKPGDEEDDQTST